MAELTLVLRKAKRSNEVKLDLSSRQIHFLPSDLYGLSKLEILNLSNNAIVSLDQKIAQLTNLKVLDLSDNSIMDLPQQILKLENLQALILDGNPLTKKFQPLIGKNASLDIRKTLRQCFGLEPSSTKQQESPKWLDEKQGMNDTKTFGRIVEMEGKYKSEQKRVEELQKQLDKMTLKEKKSSKESFDLEVQSILQINFQQLDVGEQISMGGFSTIHKGSYKGLKVAIKKTFNPKITDELIKEFSNEINMLAKFRHPNIVLLIGICSIPPTLAIVTELIQRGSLYDLLHKRKTQLSVGDKSKIVKQILSAICYLHEHDIVHRDIKSHNFLVDENFTVKLCDFGLAKNKETLNQGSMQFSGTPVYMAQQLFQKKSYDQTVDVFALGTLIYQIYTNQIPYFGLDPADIKERLIKDSSLPLKNGISKQVLEKVNQCRNQDSSARPHVIKLLNLSIW